MLAVAGQAMPIFWLGIMLIIVFAVRLKALPASGYGTWQHFLMPAFTLGAFLAPLTMRLVRSGVIEIMNMDYIRTARAKGVGENTVVVKHAFRNACIPIITVLGLQFGQLLGGAIVTETVFAWPGVATLTVESIRNQDFPVVQCAVVLLALIIVSINFLVDIIVGFIDPRIRVGGQRPRRGGPRGRRARGPARRPAPHVAAPALALQVGRGSHRDHPDDRRQRGVGAMDLALGPAVGGHPAPAGAAGLDGRRHARARAGHRPGGARPALARDLRRARVVDHRRGRGARVLEHRRAARPRRGLLRRTHGLDHHDAGQRHAHVPLRAARPRRHRRARA